MTTIGFLFSFAVFLILFLNGYTDSKLDDSNHEMRIYGVYVDKSLYFPMEIREAKTNRILYTNTLTEEETRALLKKFNIPEPDSYHFDYETGVGTIEIELVQYEYPSKYTQKYKDYIDELRESSIYE